MKKTESSRDVYRFDALNGGGDVFRVFHSRSFVRSFVSPGFARLFPETKDARAIRDSENVPPYPTLPTRRGSTAGEP